MAWLRDFTWSVVTMTRTLSPTLLESEWVFTQTAYRKEYHSFYETLFCLANGYMGLRNTLDFESDYSIPGVFFAEAYDHGIAVRTEIANAPNWLPLQFYLDSAVPLNLDYARLLDFKRSLDLRSGTVHVALSVEDERGRVTDLEWLVLVHATEVQLGLVSGRVVPRNYSGTIGVAGYLDWRFGNSYMGGFLPQIQTYHFRILRSEHDVNQGLLVEAETHGTATRIVEAVRLVVDRDARYQQLRSRGRIGEFLAAEVARDQPLQFVKYAACFHSLQCEDKPLVRLAQDALRRYMNLGPRELIAAHRHSWGERWARHDVQIEGDTQAQASIRFGLFHLIQSIQWGKSCQNTAARGLTSEYHSGHFFYNTEFFKLPYWVYADPSVARALIMFRCCTLKAARRNAAATGLKGARYPEEGDLEGEPAAPWEIKNFFQRETFHEWSTPEKYFLSAAVAYAIWLYHRATVDHDFMWDQGLEVLVETARFAADLLRWDPNKHRYVIRSVMGPDEYHYHVDNNFFTNYMVRWNIQYTLEMLERYETYDHHRLTVLLDRLGFNAEERQNWRAAAALVYLPDKSPEGVIEQHEGYFDLPDQVVVTRDANGRPVLESEDRVRAQTLQSFPTRLIKEADIVLLFSLFPEAFGRLEKCAGYEYYVLRTTHESSLSASPYGLVAADIGDFEAAKGFFRLAARYNIDFLPRETYRNGLHLAAYAGAWQILVHGFAGISVCNDELHVCPRLPDGWTSLAFKFHWRGAWLAFRVTRQEVEIKALTAPNVGAVLRLAGKTVPLDPERSVRFPYTMVTRAL